MWEEDSESKRRESMYLKRKGAISRAFSCGCGVSDNEAYWGVVMLMVRFEFNKVFRFVSFFIFCFPFLICYVLFYFIIRLYSEMTVHVHVRVQVSPHRPYVSRHESHVTRPRQYPTRRRCRRFPNRPGSSNGRIRK